MFRVELTNSLSRVWASPALIRALDQLTSYPIEGAQYSQAFKSKVWDGREHLLRRARKGDHHLIPTGILGELEDWLADAEVVDKRRMPGERREFNWIGPPLREYQQQAIDAAIKDRGWFTGRGLLNLPIRSGKTKLAAGLMCHLGFRTLFVVPSDLLLYQTVDALKEVMEPAPIGIVGAGEHKPDWITVATAQTLLARPKLAAKLLGESDLFIMDESHHLEGPAWRGLALKADAPYKLGLSATIFVSQLRDNAQSSIWLKACTGPILYRVSMNRLIRQGYLMRPRIVFYKFQHPVGTSKWNWQRVVKECLAQNRHRNCLIADLAERAAKKGKRVLIDTGRKDQMKSLRDYLLARDISVDIVHGGTPPQSRWGIIRKFQAGETQCLIGTVFGEGVDIPELEVVINAEGQKSATASIQRMRNLTPSEGKGEVLFIDIADLGQTHLAGHALERLKLYRGMRGFIVRVCKAGDIATDPLAG